jgi:outer membrane protein OmpA-like peptidoglycan-associated protein
MLDQLGLDGGEGLRSLAGLLGTSEDNAKTAAGAAVPAMLGGLSSRASKPSGAAALFDLAKSNDGSILDNVSGFLGRGDSGPMGGLASAIFGKKESALTEGIASASGVDASSITRMLPMLAPLVMGFLGKKAAGSSDQGGFLSSLTGDVDGAKAGPFGKIMDLLDGDDDPAEDETFVSTVRGLLPAGGASGTAKAAAIGGAAAVGGVAAGGVAAAKGAASGATERTTAAAARTVPTAERERDRDAGFPWWWVLAAIAGVILLGLLASQCLGGDDDDDGTSTDDTGEVSTDTFDLTDIQTTADANAGDGGIVSAEVDDDGAVTLVGTVPSEEDKTALNAAVLARPGVTSVNDDEVIVDAGEMTDETPEETTPPSTEAPEPEPAAWTIGDVQGAIDGVDEGVIAADNGDGTITLSGEVATAALRRDAVAAAEGVVGADAEVLNEITLTETDIAAELDIEGINFAVNSADIDPASETELDKVIPFMEANPGTSLRIEGYTDVDGDEAANQTLSQDRADSVRNYLVAAGVDESRLTAEGFGESTTFGDDKAANRRIEFKPV